MLHVRIGINRSGVYHAAFVAGFQLPLPARTARAPGPPLHLGKPHSFERACEQLLEASGQHVTFLTGVALLNSATGQCQVDCVPFTVTMRELDRERVERYVTAEQPLDCAGSFKAEGLGVSLFKSTHGCDATSLFGLPLIRLVDMLTTEGVTVP